LPVRRLWPVFSIEAGVAPPTTKKSGFGARLPVELVSHLTTWSGTAISIAKFTRRNADRIFHHQPNLYAR